MRVGNGGDGHLLLQYNQKAFIKHDNDHKNFFGSFHGCYTNSIDTNINDEADQNSFGYDGHRETDGHAIEDDDCNDHQPFGHDERNLYWESQEALLQEILERYSSSGSKSREELSSLIELARNTKLCDCLGLHVDDCSKCSRRAIVNFLRGKGINASICTSMWKKTHSIPGEKCQWCGVNLLLPLQLQANSVRCPNCEYIIQLQHSPDLYFHPEGNGCLNWASNNCNGMGFPAYRNCRKQDFEPSWLNGYPRYMQSYQMPMQVLPPTFHGQKRAVLCGVSYKGHPKSLKGSVNDVFCMKYFLVERMGFPNSSVIVLTEEEKDPCRVPTKHNIQRALHWLVQGCQSGDSLVFHYSGHGSRVRDHDGDEIDGHDESLCPVDYKTEGKILDDEINATLVRPLPRGATLHAIIDTCFSGTFLDLPFMCRMNGEGYYRWVDHSIPYAAYKGTRGGLAISISACDDDQNSGDTTVFTGTATGALTYSFIQTVEREPRLTYGRLLSTMRNSISKAQNGFLNFTNSLQEPQLSSSEQFDIYSKAIIL